MNGRRTRAGRAPLDTEPWAATTGIREAFEAWLTYLSNSGRGERYAEQIKLFLGLGNKRTAYQPLCHFLLAKNVTKVGQLNADVLDGWLAHIRPHHSDYGYMTSVKLMKRWLNFLMENGDLAVLPIRLRTPKEPETEIAVFTDDEIDRIHRVVNRENVRDYALFMLLVDTGMRCEEVCSLTLDSLRLDRSEIAVVGKGKKFRVLTLTESLGPLKKYLAVRPKVATDALFLSFYSTPVFAGGKFNKPRTQTGKLPWSEGPLTTGGLRQAVVKWGKLAKVTEARCSPHTFRHYFAISYLRAGGDVFSLQRILGHAKIEMTMRYAKMVDIDIKQRQQKYSPALRLTAARYKKAV